MLSDNLLPNQLLKKHILFIINPNSGYKRGIRLIDLLPKHLDESRLDYSYQLTEYAKHATEIAKQAIIDKIDIVIAVGGDGLVNEVFQSLVNTDVAFSIIPMGSGNGVARSLGIKMNIEKALINLNQAKYSKIDTVLFNERPYIGVAGIGFDGLIAWEFSKTKKRGMVSYVKIILRQLAAFRSNTFRVNADSEKYEFDAFILTIANTQQYGNDAFIAPHALPDDGHLDMIVVKKHSKWLLPVLAYQVMTKRVHKSKYVETIRASKFVIQSSYRQSHIDGEPILAQSKNTISILPLSLSIYS